MALPFALIFSKAIIAWAGFSLPTGTSTSLLLPGSLHRTKLLEAILFPFLAFFVGLGVEGGFFGDGEGFGGDNGGDNGVLGFLPSVLLLISLPFGLDGEFSLGGGGGSLGATLPPPPLPLPFGLDGEFSPGGGGGGSLAGGDDGFLGEGPAGLLSFLAK